MAISRSPRQGIKVHVGRHAGFCWGVRRAVGMALEAVARHGHKGPVQTLGPLIHNPQALEHLSLRRIRTVERTADLREGTVVIRAHGIPMDDHRELQGRRRQGRLRVFNATCPAVAHVQGLIRRHAARGGFVVILGDASHAEVQAHRSHASCGHAVVATLDEAERLDGDSLRGALVVAQTTFATADFQAISACLARRRPGIRIRNTICPDTWKRQEEADRLGGQSDAVVVIGGRNSNNTKHLVDAARARGTAVQWVASAEDLDLSALPRHGRVSVISGASTPHWTVDEVVQALEGQGRPALRRTAKTWARILEVPFLAGLSATLILVSMAGLDRIAWPQVILPLAFHLGLSALAPFASPQGPERQGRALATFLKVHRTAFLALGILAWLTAAGLGAWMGPMPFCTVGTLGLVALGLHRLPPGSAAARLKTLPASQEAGPALALALLALTTFGTAVPPLGAVAGAEVFGTVLAVSLALQAMGGIRAFSEDRVVGREVMAVALGTRATRWVGCLLLATAIAVGVHLGAGP